MVAAKQAVFAWEPKWGIGIAMQPSGRGCAMRIGSLRRSLCRGMAALPSQYSAQCRSKLKLRQSSLQICASANIHLAISLRSGFPLISVITWCVISKLSHPFLPCQATVDSAGRICRPCAECIFRLSRPYLTSVAVGGARPYYPVVPTRVNVLVKKYKGCRYPQ